MSIILGIRKRQWWGVSKFVYTSLPLQSNHNYPTSTLIICRFQRDVVVYSEGTWFKVMDPKSLLHFVLRRSSSIISCMLLGFSRKNSLFVPLNLDGLHRFSAEKMEAGCSNIITMPSFHAISDSFFRSVLPECARPEIEEDSSTHGPSDGQIPLIGLVFAITSYFFGTKGAFEVGLNRAFLGAIVAGYISIISLLSLVLSRLVLLPTENNIVSRKYYDVSTIKICKTSLNQLLKDAAVISTASMTSLFTSGQILSRPCDPSMQDCSHMKDSQYLSADQWATVFLGVLLIQLSVKGCSRVALFISLAISISTINLSLILVESQSIYLINKIFMCVVIISFEIQRTVQQSSFEIRMAANGNCSRDATTWTANESMQELDLTSNAVLELEATINNSAHDLKSPCTALGLGIESLMKNLAHQRDAPHDVLTAQNFEVVKGMYQTLMFMNMSINRSMVNFHPLSQAHLKANLSLTMIFPNLFSFHFNYRTTRNQPVASAWPLL
jgi:hypothetical protein